MREREDYDEDLQALHKLMERATKDSRSHGKDPHPPAPEGMTLDSLRFQDSADVPRIVAHDV